MNDYGVELPDEENIVGYSTSLSADESVFICSILDHDVYRADSVAAGIRSADGLQLAQFSSAVAKGWDTHAAKVCVHCIHR